MSSTGFYDTLQSQPCIFDEGCYRFISPKGSEKNKTSADMQRVDWTSDPSMTRILILDDQPEFRKQLSSVITFSGLVVAGEAGSVPEALELLPTISPDLAIVDIDLPGLNGIDGTLLLKKASPQLRVILVSASSDQSALFMKAAARVGAECFISKDHLDPEVIKSWGRP
jgi:CheY-like chemotaxis protein